MTNNPHIDVARRVLAELAGMAEHASMTGSLKGGQRAAAVAFNGALATFRAHDAVPDGMFEPLDVEAADYGSLGVQSRLLLAVLEDEPESRRKRKEREERDANGGLGAVVALAPFLDSNDLAAMIQERIDEDVEVSDGFLTALAPFLDSHALGDLIRRRVRPGASPKSPTHPTPPAAEPPAPEPSVDLRPVVPASTSLETLAGELRRSDLSIDERRRIATRLAEIAFDASSEG